MYRRYILALLILFLTFPAFAGVVLVDSYNYTSRSPSGCTELGATVSSTVMDLDVTCSSSYSGSGQTWANLESSPADSSGQTAYDVYRGETVTATNDDPTFNGSAGSSAAFWSLDGSDIFRLVGSQTTFLDALHKTTGGTDFWIAIAFRFKLNNAAQGLVSTQGSSVSSRGVSVRTDSSEATSLEQGSGSDNSQSISSASALADGTDYVVIWSHSGTTTRRWINTTSSSSATQTFVTTSSAAISKFAIGTDDGSETVPNGTRVYAVSMGNAFLDNTGATAIFSAYETRHARDYTP